MNETLFYSLLIYLFLFVFGSLGFALWRIRRRKERAPVEFKLLRGPGESLRRRMVTHDEFMLFRYVVAALLPPAAAILVGIGVVHLANHLPLTPTLVWAILAIVFLMALVPAILWVERDFRRYRATRLGYLGERAVGDQLTPLLAQGYAVFHDIPANGGKKPFNLDHVAVGPSGVALIETKTVRKQKPKPGVEDFKVFYDGEKLHWPHGENRLGLDQAFNEAEWLRKWIQQHTGIDTPVKPILALPGWFVVSTARGAVTVVNHKQVPSAVRGNNGRLLTDEQIDLIARQLDLVCRDVED